jgi:hypothetical protein
MSIVDYDHAGWHPRAVCECGWHVYAPFGDTFHVHSECCPECGSPKYRWKVMVMKQVEDYAHARWWNPFTWFAVIKWETRGDA